MSGHDDKRYERHDDEHHEYDEHAEHHEHDDHAGNGIVNHGPEGQGPEGPRGMGRGLRSGYGQGPGPGQRQEQGPGGLGRIGSGLDGLDGPDGFGSGLDGLGSDELALRRILHQAVLEIEPSDGTLEHLRRAVPARRARKRQALVGMAAAALFIGTAVPALIHVSNATGSNADPSMAGQASEAQGGVSQGKGPDGGSSGSAGSSKDKDKGKGGQKGTGDKGKGATSGTAGGANPTASLASAPACTAVQLGGTSAVAGSPDSTGTVYGTFRVANVSSTSCTVSGAGGVSATAQGAADQTKILVATHAAGDAASGLPDPTQYVSSLVLQPGAAYEVKFAWVPSATCPTTGGGSDPSPDPTPSGDSTESGGTSSEGVTGTSPQLLRADGVADGSVAVSHTTEAGSPTATTTVSNACAGTVYRTGVLAGA